MRKIKAIIKRPDEQYGHVTNISDTLKNGGEEENDD